ncbi:MAG: metallophosphoesterase [Chitinophagales bacterium]
MQRRKFIKGMLGMAGAGLLAGIYSWQIEPFWLEFVKKKMTIANLPEELDGMTMIQISDIHIGKRVASSFITDSFEKAEKYNPDFVVYTGDFVDIGNAKDLAELKKVMPKSLKGSKGTIAILGNHDYGKRWSESDVADDVVSILEENNITVLRNDKVAIEGLNFIGIDDYWGMNYDAEKAMNHLNNEEANIVLCHNPDVVDLDIWNDYQGWILSGHTHGGQCKPPFLPPPILPVKNRNYTAGEIALNDGRTLYINRALGHSFQARFNVRPEITIFELNKT